MNVNVDDLQIVPVHPIYTEEYRRALLKSKQHINTFLDFNDIDSTTFRDTSSYLSGLKKLENIYPAFLIKNGRHVLAHFQWTEAWDERGVQFLYWVGEAYNGLGIATEVTQLLVDRAFLGFVYEYVEIHTDAANLASRRIPEKLGFEIVDSYKGAKFGTMGTGDMDMWMLWNPYLSQAVSKELPLKGAHGPFRWGVGARAEKQLMNRVIANGLNKHSRIKQRMK
jgi:hypothetical protein